MKRITLFSWFRKVSAFSRNKQAVSQQTAVNRQRLAYAVGMTALIGSMGVIGSAYGHYSQKNVGHIPLSTELVKGQNYTSDAIAFQQLEGDRYNISFGLQKDEKRTELTLKDIDLSLMIPQVPERAYGNADLVRWFLTEREFNRQRVTFAAGSPHIATSNSELLYEITGVSPEQLSISLTNNCLGAGYWELAIATKDESGQAQKIYQGYFQFPKGSYAQLVAQLNPTSYAAQARTMEAWPGFRFLSGLPFDLESLRQVTTARTVASTDLASEPVVRHKEQQDKAALMIADAAVLSNNMTTWADIREQDLSFQSFVPPGVYVDEQPWQTDYSQLFQLREATVRTISPHVSAEAAQSMPKSAATKPLAEIELSFENKAGKLRRWIISGVDLESLPQLAPQNYSDGLYRPLGFGPTFTEDYESLKQLPPHEDPFFSVILDEEGKVMNYRQDIGLNGLVMHRSLTNPNVLHIYLMSYERITLVGHYVVDLADRQRIATQLNES